MSNINILICNVHSVIIHSLINLLSVEGYKVDVANHEHDAIQKILRKKYRAFIIGLNMEDISGVKIIQIIKTIDANLPIITITEKDSIETQRMARMERIFYYFVEPIDPEEMKAVVKSAIFKYHI